MALKGCNISIIDEYLTSKNCSNCSQLDFNNLNKDLCARTMLPMQYPVDIVNQTNKKKEEIKKEKINFIDLFHHDLDDSQIETRKEAKIKEFDEMHNKFLSKELNTFEIMVYERKRRFNNAKAIGLRPRVNNTKKEKKKLQKLMKSSAIQQLLEMS